MNPNDGYVSFDNFGVSSLVMFQMLTMDNWSELILYPLMEAMGPGAPITYCVMLIMFGAFFAMQLLVAILSSKFAQVEALDEKHIAWVSYLHPTCRSATVVVQHLLLALPQSNAACYSACPK